MSNSSGKAYRCFGPDPSELYCRECPNFLDVDLLPLSLELDFLLRLSYSLPNWTLCIACIVDAVTGKGLSRDLYDSEALIVAMKVS